MDWHEYEYEGADYEWIGFSRICQQVLDLVAVVIRKIIRIYIRNSTPNVRIDSIFHSFDTFDFPNLFDIQSFENF